MFPLLDTFHRYMSNSDMSYRELSIRDISNRDVFL